MSINSDIESLSPEARGNISDGYHTFKELYDHRIELYLALCRAVIDNHLVYKTLLHSDGTSMDGWFILGINDKAGEQITYHLPMSRWGDAKVLVLDKAPEWDGHTSEDVLNRLKNLSLWTQ